MQTNRQPFQAVKVTDTVYWVGAIDWGLRYFHGYSTLRGSTYNAYLVLGDAPILIDTVRAGFFDEMCYRIASVVDPSEIRYIISNHAEMDHSGELPRAVERFKPEKVFASRNGVRALQEHMRIGHELTELADGSSHEIGGRPFTFLDTKMLHWPDSMVSYLADEQVLFSQDIFGMHLATSARFDDEVDPWLLHWEACKYYANIVLPFSKFVTKCLSRIKDLGLQFRVVAPDHGPIWRSKIAWIVDLYGKWAQQPPARKAVVCFDTMWHSGDVMARSVAEGLTSRGVANVVMAMDVNNRSDVMTELMEAGALVVGSPTLNGNVFPTLADVLTYIKGLKPENKIGAVFGSFGWSGEAAKHLGAWLDEMGIQRIGEPVTVKYVPGREDLLRCFDLGAAVAEELKRRCPEG